VENVPSDGGSHREKLILQEIDRLGKERDDLRAKLNRAEMLIDRLTEENHQMVWLTDRVERAEAVKESLKASLMEISGFSAYWKCLRGNEEAWENVWNIATDALISLRTAEESSVVGLIDSTPAKQSSNAENADGCRESLIDEELKKMTRLEWVLKNREDSLEIRNRIVTKFCPSDYGLMNIYCTDSSCCRDCWNQEVEE
jgi:hypothetical protein